MNVIGQKMLNAMMVALPYLHLLLLLLLSTLDARMSVLDIVKTHCWQLLELNALNIVTVEMWLVLLLNSEQDTREYS